MAHDSQAALSQKVAALAEALETQTTQVNAAETTIPVVMAPDALAVPVVSDTPTEPMPMPIAVPPRIERVAPSADPARLLVQTAPPDTLTLVVTDDTVAPVVGGGGVLAVLAAAALVMVCVRVCARACVRVSVLPPNRDSGRGLRVLLACSSSGAGLNPWLT